MEPSNTDLNNYVGLEIECFGSISREDIKEALNKDKTLKGKFEVGTDSSIEPDPQSPEIGEHRLNIKRKDKWVECDEYRYKTTRSWNGIQYAKKKKGKYYYKTTIDEYYFEEKYLGNGKWEGTGVKYYPDEDYLEGECYYNDRDYLFYIYEYQYKYDDCGDLTDYWYDYNDDYYEGYEVRLLIKQSEINSMIPRVYKILNKLGLKVNESCGLHVHLDMRNRNEKLAYKNLYKCQDLMLLLHPSRVNNEYCKKNDRAEYNYTNKYSIINTEPYDDLRTLEIRVGAATMDSKRVVAWVRLLCNIADLKKELTEQIKTVKDYLKHFKMSKRGVNALNEMKKKGA